MITIEQLQLISEILKYTLYALVAIIGVFVVSQLIRGRKYHV